MKHLHWQSERKEEEEKHEQQASAFNKCKNIFMYRKENDFFLLALLGAIRRWNEAEKGSEAMRERKSDENGKYDKEKWLNEMGV